jgi:hypothetical protein
MPPCDSSDATMLAELAEPPPLRSEDASAVELAHKRLTKSKRFTLTRLPNLRALWTGRRSKALRDQPPLSDDSSFAEIGLNVNDSFDDLNVHQDIYKWAVVYENQRGCELGPHRILLKNAHSTSESLFFPRRTTPGWDYFRMTHPHSPSLRPTVGGISSLKLHCMATPSLMATGVGYPRYGWSICATKVSTMTASSIIGYFVAISGAQSLVRSALEVWCVAGDGCAL